MNKMEIGVVQGLAVVTWGEKGKTEGEMSVNMQTTQVFYSSERTGGDNFGFPHQ